MTILRQKLVDGGLGNDEINDALEFYEELFLDAGYENEEKTAQNLGDPEKLAQQILAENGAVGFVRAQPTMDDYVDNRGAQTQAQQTQQSEYDIAPDNRRTALIIIVICSSIIWAPTLIGLLTGAFALAIGLAAAIFSIGCAGVGTLVLGVVTTFQAPPVGILTIGVGLILTGLGVLLFMPFCKFVIGLFKKFFTWLIGGLKKIFNNIQNNKAVSDNG